MHAICIMYESVIYYFSAELNLILKLICTALLNFCFEVIEFHIELRRATTSYQLRNTGLIFPNSVFARIAFNEFLRD